MNSVKRAFLSMKRRRLKVLILAGLVFSLSSLFSGAISIQQAIRQTEYNLWSSLPAVASIGDDFEAVMAHQEIYNEQPMMRLDGETVRTIAELPYVRSFDFSMDFTFFNDAMKAPSQGGRGALGDIRARGVSNPFLTDAQEGIIEITEGRAFTEAEMEGLGRVVVVSEAFAQQHHLEVGSVFTLDARVYDLMAGGWANWRTDEFLIGSQSFDVEVVGLFDLIYAFDTGNEAWDTENRDRFLERVYVPLSLVEAGHRFSWDLQVEQGWVEPEWEMAGPENMPPTLFFLYDALDIPAFSQAANEILGEFWAIQDLSGNFNQLAASMETMEWIAEIILLSTFAAGMLILILIILLFLRDRRFELGIYLALGERKIKIAVQILVEILVPSLIAVAFSMGSGSFLANGISRQLLENDLLRQITQYENLEFTNRHLMLFDPGRLSAEEMMAAYETGLSSEAILFIFLAAVLTIMGAALFSLIYTLRMKPKNILM